MMNKAPSASEPSHWQARRPLSEPVLESVEAEIGAQAIDSGVSTSKFPWLTGNGADASGSFWWNKMREQLSIQVRENPARWAVLALGTGALTAWLVARGLRRTRRMP